MVRLRWSHRELTGFIPELVVSEIHVPLPYSRLLRGLPKSPEGTNLRSRYNVTLCYGKDYDPWICDCRLTPAAGYDPPPTAQQPPYFFRWYWKTSCFSSAPFFQVHSWLKWSLS